MNIYKVLINSLISALLGVLICLGMVQLSLGQASLSELDRSEYFDFWIGKWDLTWKSADGNIERGTNTVEKILDGKVIKENFEAISGSMKGFTGKSYSVYNSRTREWKQTWVDNQGAYLDFTGKFEGDKRIFIRETRNKNGNSVLQRMVFYDITQNSFSWNWEKSVDNGKTWQLQWEIAYQRH